MDEDRLTKDIEQYKEQFLQVQNVLQITGEEGQEDLVKIRDDLVELIHVSEESLLSLKKSRLLQMIDDHDSSQPSASNKIDDQLEGKADDLNNKEIAEEDIIGTKCRVSYTQEWGLSQHHNAMVFSIEISDDDDEDDDDYQIDPDKAKVRVLFLNPTHISMVPCPYFMDGKCRFNADDCRYSHGFIVDIDYLKPFKEPNFSDIKDGQQCLARYSDNIWYKATIKSFDQENQQLLVHYDTYNTDCTLGMEAVFPLDEVESPDNSDDDASSLSSNSLSTDITIDDNDLILEWKPSGTSLGDWEQHTRGIGSKLMAKMGYIFGKGLGKDSDGRIEPVEVVVLPQGKSLDACAELREKKKLKEPFKKKRKSSAQMKAVPSNKGKSSDVFAFINHKLGASKGNIQDILGTVTPTSDQFDVKDRKKRKSAENDKNINWNVKLFKIHEEIAAAEKQLKKKKQAHQRQSMDKSTSSIFKKKVDDLEHHIQQLKENERTIKQKIHQKDQHRKLTVF